MTMVPGVMSRKDEEEMNLTTASVNTMKACFIFHDEFVIIVDFPSNIYLVNHVIVCVVNAILTIATVFLNSATIMAYWKSSQLKNKMSYFLIMIQSFVDLGVGVIGTFSFTLRLADSIAGNGNCGLAFATRKMSPLTAGMSVMMLSAINIERYLGVLHPIVHRKQVTRKTLSISLIFVWFTWMILFCTSFIDDEAFTIFGLVYTSVFLVTGAYIYTKIFLTGRSSSRVIAQSTNNSMPSTRSPSEMIEKRQFLQDLKLAKSCFAVVICFFICFLPISILSVANKSSFDSIVYIWSVTFVLMNSSLNSLVLVWRNGLLRSEIKRVAKGLFRCS